MRKQSKALVLALCLTFLTGCGKEEVVPSLSAPETTQAAATQPPETLAFTEETQETIAPAPEGTPVFDYKPGKMGAYVIADSSIEAGPEVLDSVSMTWPDNVTRVRVSDIQYDFVRGGEQVGGFLLVDIPRDMLDQAAETREDFEALVDLLGKQVMPDAYPSQSHKAGGGRIPGRSAYLYIPIERNDYLSQYRFHIFVGEQYCYAFWIDEHWWGDSGFGLMDSLAADDIKPELNEVEFAWSAFDGPKATRPSS